MGLFSKYKIKAKDIKQYVANYGGCLATKMITQKGLGVNYMYREKPDNDIDSGWRFFSGHETDDYVSNPKNVEVYDVNTIVNYSPDIMPFLDIEEGFALERDLETGRFYLLKNDEKTKFDLDYAVSQLRKRDEDVPVHAKLPVKEDLEKLAKELGLDLESDIPLDYARYLLTASDVSFGVLEPVQILYEKSRQDYLTCLLEEMESLGLGGKGMPVCSDNGDIYYMAKDGKVFLYSADDSRDVDQWDNLADWILNEWILNRG